MAIVNILSKGLQYEETINVHFEHTSFLNFKFTRDGNEITMEIQPQSFMLDVPIDPLDPTSTVLVSTSPIPNEFVPSKLQSGWIVINGGNYKSCSVVINPQGIITISNGPSGSLFNVYQVYNTIGNQFIRYLD